MFLYLWGVAAIT